MQTNHVGSLLPKLRRGDIVWGFVHDPEQFVTFLSTEYPEPVGHIAIVDGEGDSWRVIEAFPDRVRARYAPTLRKWNRFCLTSNGGVREIPLEVFASRFTELEVRRFSEGYDPHVILGTCREHLGKGYNATFCENGKGRYYCSQLLAEGILRIKPEKRFSMSPRTKQRDLSNFLAGLGVEAKEFLAPRGLATDPDLSLIEQVRAHDERVSKWLWAAYRVLSGQFQRGIVSYTRLISAKTTGIVFTKECESYFAAAQAYADDDGHRDSETPERLLMNLFHQVFQS